MSNKTGAGRSDNEAGLAASQSTRLDGDGTQTLRQTEVSLTRGNVETNTAAPTRTLVSVVSNLVVKY